MHWNEAWAAEGTMAKLFFDRSGQGKARFHQLRDNALLAGFVAVGRLPVGAKRLKGRPPQVVQTGWALRQQDLALYKPNIYYQLTPEGKRLLGEEEVEEGDEVDHAHEGRAVDQRQ